MDGECRVSLVLLHLAMKSALDHSNLLPAEYGKELRLEDSKAAPMSPSSFKECSLGPSTLTISLRINLMELEERMQQSKLFTQENAYAPL